MLASLRKHIDREDEGFTLIELMVVVLIIAILLAIAIPTFLGARERAQNRAAQSDIRNALAAEKVYYTDAEVYTTGVTALQSIEPSLTFTNGQAAGEDYVDVAVSTDAKAVCIERKSAAGTTFALIDMSVGTTAGTYYDDAACPTVPAQNAAIPTGFVKSGW